MTVDTRKVMTFSDTLKGYQRRRQQQKLTLTIRQLDRRIIGEDYKEQLMDEIELLDGASAEFDQEHGSAKESCHPVFLRFRADKLWCGDIFTALS